MCGALRAISAFTCEVCLGAVGTALALSGQRLASGETTSRGYDEVEGLHAKKIIMIKREGDRNLLCLILWEIIAASPVKILNVEEKTREKEGEGRHLSQSGSI